jgi:hypothetical protein
MPDSRLKSRDRDPIRVINSLQLDGLPHAGVMAKKSGSEIGSANLDNIRFHFLAA